MCAHRIHRHAAMHHAQDPASRLQEVECEIERVRALQAALHVPKAGPPPNDDEVMSNLKTWTCDGYHARKTATVLHYVHLSHRAPLSSHRLPSCCSSKRGRRRRTPEVLRADMTHDTGPTHSSGRRGNVKDSYRLVAGWVLLLADSTQCLRRCIDRVCSKGGRLVFITRLRLLCPLGLELDDLHLDWRECRSRVSDACSSPVPVLPCFLVFLPSM